MNSADFYNSDNGSFVKTGIENLDKSLPIMSFSSLRIIVILSLTLLGPGIDTLTESTSVTIYCSYPNSL